MKVGVTGHRILMEIDKINTGIRKALEEIMNASGGEPPTLLTALAEGADRLVAEAVREIPGSRVIAVIPFELADYATDFGPEGTDSRREFDSLLKTADEVVQLPSAPTRNEGYENGGNYVVDDSDALIAVWDGQEAQGQGGTGEIVNRAHSQGKLVVIVRAGNRKPGTTEPTTLGEEQGKVIVQPAG